MTERTGLAKHYATLAESFDDHWVYSPGFVEWMSGRLLTHLHVRSTDHIVDLGCGTGLYSQPLADAAARVTAVDPEPEMIRRHTSHPRLTSIVGTAEQFASGQFLAGADYDAILLKEVLHHLADRVELVRGLATRLRPGGRLLVVTLPPTLSHPLFPAALQRYTRRPLTGEQIGAWMGAVGLTTGATIEEIDVELPIDRWIKMVSSRYMSLLAGFDDAELDAGIVEIRRRCGPVVRFADRYTFTLGRRHH